MCAEKGYHKIKNIIAYPPDPWYNFIYPKVHERIYFIVYEQTRSRYLEHITDRTFYQPTYIG